MSDRKDHANYCSRTLVVCDYCEGSGLFLQYSYSGPDVEASDCPKCNGEGRVLRTEIIQTRPITQKDKVSFRKIITY